VKITHGDERNPKKGPKRGILMMPLGYMQKSKRLFAQQVFMTMPKPPKARILGENRKYRNVIMHGSRPLAPVKKMQCCGGVVRGMLGSKEGKEGQHLRAS
jgi:hypothetical protein